MVYALISQDGCQQEGFWEVVGHVVSPFDLSQTLLVDGGLLVRCSLPAPPANGYYGAWPEWAVSVSVLPLTAIACGWENAALCSNNP